MEEKTTYLYDLKELDDKIVEETLLEVIEILKDKKYRPINQLTGYLMSGDPGYITSYKGARTLLTSFDRSKILEVLLKNI